MDNLNANTITLQGRHIIEASAGTGKTFNITKLYIRLLLEKKLLPSNILVMTFTKDATQEIIGRVEKEIRDVLASYTDEKKESDKENYKHLKRSLLEIDEAAIFTIHGFCKKVLSEQAFASGIEMDVSMEVDTSDILQKVVEDFFRKHINKSETNFGYLQIYKLHTPEKFLDDLENIIRSNYEILTKQAISLDEFKILKKQQLELFINNHDIVDDFLSKLGKGELQGKRVDEYYRVLEWLKLDNQTLFPENISIITDGRKISAKLIKPIFIGIKELRDLQQEIKQAQAAQFIRKACLQIRQDFAKAKEQKGVLDFDDLITKLCQSVKKSPELVKTLQKQYPVALIDEFQDTDAEQYEILDTIYPLKNSSSHSHEGRNLLTNGLNLKDTRLREYDSSSDQNDSNLLLLMIGDPKQAIYGFRGGDIFTYLKAKDSCPEENQWSMDTNWRSTGEMIKAYNRLFYKQDYQPEEEGQIGTNIFSDGIGYQLVKASPDADKKTKDFDDNFKPINYFYYEVAEDDNKSDIDTNLSLWTVNEITRLLNTQKVAENDIAILVENGKQAKIIQQALQAKNLSSVYLSQRDNVYHSQEAKEILALMEGINDLENKSMLKRALSTSLLGGRADKFISYIDENDVSAWDDEIEKAKSLRQQWHKYGFMTFIMQIIHENFTQRADSKERIITNILHLAELIKVAENKYKHSNQLIKWYRHQLNNTATSEGELRLESDDNLIKIITIHGSKGLEYSVVFIPFACYASTKKFETSNFTKYYDGDLKQTVYKIGKDDSVKQQADKEVIEELMRLFYVAVTRAEHRCYIGVAKYNNSEKSPLARFLGYQKDDDWLEKIQSITANPANQSLLINIADMREFSLKNLSSKDKNSDYDTLKANYISKLENDSWEMLSFSKISKSKVQNTALEKEIDEAEDDKTQASDRKLAFRFTASKGADMGNILHNVLEHTDFSLDEIDGNLLQEQMDRYKVVAAEDFDNLKLWLEECLEAHIPYIDTSFSSSNESIQYGLFDIKDKGFCLKTIPNSKTLKEAEFYFPVKNENLYKTNILEILQEYRELTKLKTYSHSYVGGNLPTNYQDLRDTRLREYGNLTNVSNQKIFGMLHGFIDLIFEYEGKFYVADYKSNYLGDTLEDYNQQAMQEKNQSSFYDLQYLIYSVALDKYLRQNIESYNYEKHFGGVYYFYLRGMKDGYGVYRARPNLEIINKLASLFNGDDNV
ncbi:exodeoxyribonuclease V subunit beta [Francisella tularensis]|uniref:RecBCD enzyme subunit RecB n=3 Tax=Francisella tularensis TaxID=263 RepID=Q5NF53_FRATT|nr:exodeoxyribonuclease V subunit beta [Francisella tularensis]ADA79026.1 Exodeoxyribonuclease V beta chain [Francisella tularensis subsp. tularensis NE061598]AFB79430.1 Exodeoxyribonuclease V beta chain [Francisella tularensis subsp. tularensis TIGB03]AFB80975.1 Exodeoxyribonuclease V beta chain [Francisella tularensis subsp. tularensis TI0902]AJI68226.1 exodeoxyribonuclease V, beta subunit [Francisella tularensis subsp. tularensis SCHU S4]AJI70763.1 exodeoxyribonuclease V, beta subunit [Fran